MKRFGLMLAMVMLSLVFVEGGWAGPKHYVASYGLDMNPCTLGSPCRSFAHAVDVTDSGGEVIVLDTGGYGTVTITKSISIIAPLGMYASVTPGSGANGITINALASDKVLLKGLTIKGTPGSLDGIQVNTVGTLIVDNCFISELGSDGIAFAAADSELVILNSKFNTNGAAAVYVYNPSGSVSASMNNVEMINNNMFGLMIIPSDTGTVFATVTNSLANGNAYGFFLQNSSSGTSVLNLEHCIAHGNVYGIVSHNYSAMDVIRLSDCTVTGNMNHGIYRWPISIGTIYSRQNNTVVGNGTDSNVSLTPFSPM